MLLVFIWLLFDRESPAEIKEMTQKNQITQKKTRQNKVPHKIRLK